MYEKYFVLKGMEAKQKSKIKTDQITTLRPIEGLDK